LKLSFYISGQLDINRWEIFCRKSIHKYERFSKHKRYDSFLIRSGEKTMYHCAWLNKKRAPVVDVICHLSNDVKICVLLIVSAAAAPTATAAAPTAIPDYSKQWDEYLKQAGKYTSWLIVLGFVMTFRRYRCWRNISSSIEERITCVQRFEVQIPERSNLTQLSNGSPLLLTSTKVAVLSWCYGSGRREGSRGVCT